MTKTVAGKISGVLNRKLFFHNQNDVKFILIISKEKSKTVAGKDSGVSDRISDLRL